MQLSLIEGAADAAVTGRQKSRRRAGWDPVNHACRHCGGRLLVRENADATSVVRCPQCDASAVGVHDSLCCCGEEVSGLGRVWECFVNPNPTPANPNIVLVRERHYARVPVGMTVRPSRAVNVPEPHESF